MSIELSKHPAFFRQRKQAPHLHSAKTIPLGFLRSSSMCRMAVLSAAPMSLRHKPPGKWSVMGDSL